MKSLCFINKYFIGSSIGSLSDGFIELSCLKFWHDIIINIFLAGILFNLGIGHYRDNLLKTVILDYRERLEKVNTIGTDVISDLFTNPMMFAI